MSEPRKTPNPVPLDEEKLEKVTGGISLPSDFTLTIPLEGDPFNPPGGNQPGG